MQSHVNGWRGRGAGTPIAAAVVSLAALVAVGCGASAAPSAQAQAAQDRGGAPVALAGQTAQPAAAALPVAVNCGAGAQALIRPSIVNGEPVSQVDCVPVPGSTANAVAAMAGSSGNVRYVPVTDVEDVPVQRPVYRERARPATYRTAQYDPERQVKSGRTWQKSAVIIGSSAGVGAGVGAAVGGKKGALIGAAIGGGSAAIWDQATRR